MSPGNCFMKKSIYKTVVILGLLLLAAQPVQANEGMPGFFTRAEGAAYLAWVWPHAPGMDHLQAGIFPMIHASISGTTRGKKPWHHDYNFPDLGVTLIYSDLGYPKVLGRAWGVFPHIVMPLTRKTNFSLGFRFGMGAVWLTNYYNEPDNEGNIAISNPLNILVNTSLEAGFAISEHFTIRTGFGMTHFSNGKTSTPNKGLNIPAFKLALSHSLWPNPGLPERNTNPEKNRNTSLRAFVAGGYTRLYPPGGPAFAEFTISSTLNRPVSKKVSLGFGLDVFYGGSDREVLRRIDALPGSPAGLLKPGIHLSFEQMFGKTSFIFQQGIYLYAANKEDGKSYNRAGLRHQISEKLLVNLTLKSHLFRADYLEWGFGYLIF